MKSLQRKRRSSIGVLRMTVPRRDQVRPKQFQNVLRLPESKIYLVKFLINDWSSNIRYCDVLEAK